MAKLHPAEKALIKAIGYKKDEDDFKNRQDYLAALAKEVNKLDDDEFNALDDEATDWANAALDALKNDEKIDDFEVADDKDEKKSSKKDDDDDRKSSKRSSKDDDDKKSSKRSSKDDDDDRKSSKKASKDDDDKKSSKRKSPRDYEGAKRDRYGLVADSKVSQAVKLFEKGASMKTIKDKTGGPQNNVLKKLVKDGHLVERLDGIIKVTHKDDLSPKQKQKVKDANAGGGRDDDDDDRKSSKRSSKDDDEKDTKSSSRRSSKKDEDDDRGSRRGRRRDDD